jgi:porin
MMPFLRGGITEDAGSLLEASISGGLGYQTEAFDGLLGAAVNWGRPNEDTFGPDLDDQLALELFYRASLGERSAVTVDLQYIQDPAINPLESSIWMFGFRGRVAF